MGGGLQTCTRRNKMRIPDSRHWSTTQAAAAGKITACRLFKHLRFVYVKCKPRGFGIVVVMAPTRPLPSGTRAKGALLWRRFIRHLCTVLRCLAGSKGLVRRATPPNPFFKWHLTAVAATTTAVRGWAAHLFHFQQLMHCAASWNCLMRFLMACSGAMQSEAGRKCSRQDETYHSR